MEVGMKNLAIVRIYWLALGFSVGSVIILTNVNMALAATSP
jgi:hypothetical protein